MKLYEICFSPTGGTKKAADILAKKLSDDVIPVDLTDRGVDFSKVAIDKDSAAIIAVPSYGGRVPATAIQRLSEVNGNGAKAILVCVYGNRAYEDTLVELEDTAKQSGFVIISAVAAIAEHSIVRQVAQGRPDEQDKAELTKFASKIREKLESGNMAEPAIPGNRPYKKSGGAGMVPEPTKDCVKCGLCAKKCPVGAIDPKDPHKVDKKACISCMRCVAVCPKSARKIGSVMMAAANMMLKKAASDRKDNELFI